MVQQNAQSLARFANLDRSVVALVEEGDREVSTLGTGTLYRHGKDHFLVTATHVAQGCSRGAGEIGIPLQVSDRTSSIRTIGRSRLAFASEDSEDVAVFRLDEPGVVRDLLDGGRTFLTESDVERNPSRSCVLFGWPRAHERFERDSLRTHPVLIAMDRLTSCPILFKAERRPLTSNSRPTDILLDWPATRDVWPPMEALPDLSGISGCAIWALQEAPGGVWSASKEVKILGVQHRVLVGDYIRGTGWAVVEHILQRM